MRTYPNRAAFSLVTAIFVIVMMATVAVLVTSMASKITKSTTVQFKKEQAALLAKSYTEYAIMAVTANNRAVNCLTDIEGNNILGDDTTGEGYRVRVAISYIGNNLGTCVNIGNAVVTPRSSLNIIVDTYVEYLEIDKYNGDTTDQADYITYHRRTLQKI